MPPPIERLYWERGVRRAAGADIDRTLLQTERAGQVRSD